jgi:hypothetical protein
MDSDDLFSAQSDGDYVYSEYEEQYSDEEVDIEDEFEEEKDDEEEEDWADEFDDYKDDEAEDGGRRRRRQEWE